MYHDLVIAKMATFRLLPACLWIFLAISKVCWTSSIIDPIDLYQELDGCLLFAPKRLLVECSAAATIVNFSRERPRLRPLHRHWRRWPILPNCYWLLLLAGDIHVNPGPALFPCTTCDNPVLDDQRGVCCDLCDRWTHADCARVNEDEYEKLSSDVNTEWFCHCCGRPEELSASEGHPPAWSQTHGPVVSHLNVRSLFPKIDQIRVMLGNQAVSNMVLGLSETWLDGNVNDGELQVPGYRMYRKDRSSGKGGGVMVYVSEGVKSLRREDLENDFLEVLWVQVKTKLGQMLVGNVYRLPNALASWMDCLASNLERVVQENMLVVFMGDLNCNLLKPDSQVTKLESITSEYGLTQMIRGLTRVTQMSESLIDLMYTTNPEVFLQSGCREAGISDHNIIFGEMDVEIARSEQFFREVRCFEKCDPVKLTKDLHSAPWQVMDTMEDIDAKWDYWKALFSSIVDSHVPWRRVRVRKESLPWISREIRAAMRARNYHCTKAKRTRKAEDWEKYRLLRNRVTMMIRKSKLQHFEEVSERATKNPGKA